MAARRLRRLGLFGGSFNPVHSGHVLLAREALERVKLDEVWLVPCAASADKKVLAPGALRLDWLRKALRGQAGLRVWDGELRRGGVSRTIDTLRQLRAELGSGVKFTLLLGQDQLKQVHRWKEAQQIPRLARLAIFGRGPAVSGKAWMGPLQRLTKRQFDVSSTEIRMRIKAGLPIDLLVPPELARDPRLQKTFK